MPNFYLTSKDVDLVVGLSTFSLLPLPILFLWGLLMVGNTTNWSLLNVLPKTSFIHTGFHACVSMQYIVKARRGSKTSEASNIAFINAGGVVASV